MGTDNRIEPCYLEQAQNFYRLRGLNPNGETYKKFSAALFAGQYTNEASVYWQAIDTDKSKSITPEKLARAFQRADQKSFVDSKDPYDLGYTNDKICDKDEMTADIVKYGMIPYLLQEAKKNTSPEKYQQIAERLKTGAFTITGEKRKDDINLLKSETTGRSYPNNILWVDYRYEELAKKTPGLRQLFWDKLASGQVPFFKKLPSEEVIVSEDKVKGYGDIYSTSETVDKNGALKMSTEDSTGHDTVSAHMPFNYSPVDRGRPYEDSLAEKEVKKFNTQVLTNENLEYFDSHILEALDSPEKLAKFIKIAEKPSQTAFELRTKMFVDKDRTDVAGEYQPIDDKILIAYKYLTEHKTMLQRGGVPEDKTKEALLCELFDTIIHEYYHPKQYDYIDNPPKNLSPTEEKMIRKYEDSHKYDIDCDGNIMIHGDMRQCHAQPSEQSPNLVGLRVRSHIKQWYAKRNQVKPN